MVEGRRRVIGASGHQQVLASPSHLSRSRSVRHGQSVHGRGHRDHSSHRSPLTGANANAIASDVGENTLSTGEKCREFARSFVAFIFSKVGLIVLVVGYAIGGALLFQAVEGPHEDKEFHFNKVQSFRNNTLDELWQITTQLNIFSKDTWSNRVDDRIKRFQASLIEQIRDNGYDGSLSPQWTFSGSFLFALTVITTIGYGNIAPRTDEGKITTILYAIFGIPLMLLYLTNIGGILARSFRFVYGRFCLCGNRRKAAIAATRSRSIRLQRQRSIAAATTSTPVTPSTSSTPARSPSTSRLKSLVASVSKSTSNVASKSNFTPAPAQESKSQEQAKSSENTTRQQLPSEASSPQTPGPSNVPSTEVPPSTAMPGKQKSVKIAPETPQTPMTPHSPPPATPSTATVIAGHSPLPPATFHHQPHRAPFIPFQSQFHHPFYHPQMSMSSQSTGDQIFPESSLQPPHSYDSYYPYHHHQYSPYSPYTGLPMPQPPMTPMSMTPVSPPPPVSALVAASTLGSTPAMSPTAAKVHCSRAAAITASASHAISAAASSSQDKVHVPISLCLMILVAYVSGGGFLFSIWEEDWGYLEGSYFCFISLSTIGFGDLVPGDAVVAGEGGSQERLIICSLYLLTGLALIAMCFNLMQEEVIHKIRRIGQNLGIIKDPEMDQVNEDDDDEDEDEEGDDDDVDANFGEDEHNIDHVMSSIGDEHVDQVTNNQVIVSNSQIFAQNSSASPLPPPGQFPLHESPVNSMRPFNYPLSPYHSHQVMATPSTPSTGHHQIASSPFTPQLMTPPPPPPPPPHPSAASGAGIMYSSPHLPPPPPPPFPPPPPSMMQTPFIYNWSAGQS